MNTRTQASVYRSWCHFGTCQPSRRKGIDVFARLPYVPYFSILGGAVLGADRGSMKSIGVAIEALAAVAAATLVADALQGDSPAQPTVTVDCKEDDTQSKKPPVQVSKADFILKVICPADYDFLPKPTSGEVEEVYTKDNFSDPKPVGQVCPTLTVTKGEHYKLFTFSALPDKKTTFYVKCEKTGGDKSCPVTVTVDAAKTSEGDQNNAGVPGAGTGSQALQTCDTGGKSITLSIPDKGTSAQFSCGEKFTLYPTALDKVFAENCKKQEDLKDIQRSGSGKAVITLTATKKPPKKKLCYLCASPGVTQEKPGLPSDYCIVYVESSARARFCSAASLTLLLPSMMTVLSFA